ncbi:MAG TPA: hypothetical protein VER96_20755 [Polyangiaceae bacterium]|nr:hypothetical protein [Polyangiaceae bacterium]
MTQMTPSYSSEYGSAARSSRVGVRRRELQGLQQLHPLDPAFGAPEFVLLDAHASHIFVDAKKGATIFAGNAPPHSIERWDRPRFATIYERGFVYGTGAMDWNWEKVKRESLAHSDLEDPLVAQFEGDHLLYVMRFSTEHPPLRRYNVYSRDLSAGEKARGPRDWEVIIDIDTPVPTIVPAIDANGRAVLIVNEDEPRLIVLGRDRAPDSKKPAREAERALPRERFYAISTPLGSIALLSAQLTKDADDLTGGTPLHRDMASQWRTRVRVLSERGADQWQAEVPFEVLEPAIDGGDGAIYLVGNGVARAEGGHITWSAPSRKRMRATAFATGELALAVGSELRIVGRDGTILQTFKTPNQEPILTPPALAADGRVYVATHSALLVAN